MNKKILFLALLLAFSTQLSYSQWSLGDIAFTGYQGDNTGNPSGEVDQFTFVLLRDVSAGEQISFTENGWFAAGGFRIGENTVTLEFTSALNCGTHISIAASPFTAIEDGGNTSAGNLTGNAMSFSISGDQIFAYDPANVPSAGNETGFIAAIHMNGDWDADATNTSTSAQPSIFTTLASSSIALPTEVDNAVYNCIDLDDNDVAVLRAAIHDPANWNTNNTNPFDQPACSAISCTTLSTDLFDSGDEDFSIYPNPSNGKITVRNRGIAIKNITITDINGRTLEVHELNDFKGNIDLSMNLKAGAYFVTLISNDDASTTKKLIIK